MAIGHREVARVPAGFRSLWLDVAFICGMAGVFIVNALIAFLHPHDFTSLVEQSAAGRWFGIRSERWLGYAICVNDALIGAALLASLRYRSSRAAILAWAGLWLLAVTVVKLTSI